MLGLTRHGQTFQRVICCWVGFGCLLFIASAVRAELTATVDTQHLTTDQTVNFTLTSTSESNAPDFSVLETDFEILGQSTFSQMQSHNGRIQQSLSWRLQLLPKRAGELLIPAFEIDGERSQSLDQISD